jgi:hypothetical protein
MIIRRIFLLVYIFLHSISYAQTSVPLGLCPSSYPNPNTENQDYNNIKRFLSKYEAKLSVFQKEALAKEFKTQVFWNIQPTYRGWHDYKKLLDLFGILMSQKEKEEWVTKAKKEMDKQEKTDDLEREFHYTQEAILEDHSYQFGMVEKVLVVDFDQNQEADVMCVPQDHFGPASGYEIYAKKNGRWQSVTDYAGSFEGLKTSENQIIIRYFVEDTNANVQVFLSVVLSKKGNSWELKDLLKQYYAFQTKKPLQFLRKFELFTTQSTTVLRTHPIIKDTGVMTEKTPTLIGNQVGIFPKGSEGLILAKENNWAFVAFLPTSNPEKTSFEYESDINSEVKPYHCGWIQLSK